MSRNRRGDRTRAEILDTAWELVSDRGAELSLLEIAAEAGVSRQTIYLHFGSRGGLLVAMVRHADEKFGIKEQFKSALALKDPLDRFSQTLRAWSAFVPKIFPVAVDLIRLRETDADAALAWTDRMDELREWLLDLMLSLREDSVLSEQWTPEQARDFFWSQTSVQIWALLRKECGWSDHEILDRLETILSSCLLRGGQEYG